MKGCWGKRCYIHSVRLEHRHQEGHQGDGKNLKRRSGEAEASIRSTVQPSASEGDEGPNPQKTDQVR
jgi:hypothetical protein